VSDKQLKPCPLCGYTPKLEECYGTCYTIECTNCGHVTVELQICDYLTIEERIHDEFIDNRYKQEYIDKVEKIAIKIWNTRTGEQNAEV
jgi:hypothetical protein